MTTLQSPDPIDAPSTRRLLTDRRTPPRGVLPRQLQMWLMISIAVVILLIILITGHPDPPARESAADRPAAPTSLPPERVRGFQQQLTDDESRRRSEQQTESATTQASAQAAKQGREVAGPANPNDVEARRASESLFADSLVLSRRAPVAAPIQSEIDQIENSLSRVLAATRAPQPSPTVEKTAEIPTTPAAAREDTSKRTEFPAPGSRLRIFEGTLIETVLLNRLDGTFSGPVTCLVTSPVYSLDRQHLLIPAGAKILGNASAVQTWGDSRLAVSFHRLLMPDGHTYSLELFKGLGQIGDAGLRDRVDRHYLQVFGASVAIGGLSGLTQLGAGSVRTTGISMRDEFLDAAGASLATSAGRVLDRYLNVLPTVTIREGYRVKVYLTNDFELPPYRLDAGGVR